MNSIEMRDRFASMWRAAREQSGMSQTQAALAIGVSRTTIQNWELGLSCPSQTQGFYYFNALGIQAMPFYLKLFYPNEFGDICPESPDEQIDKALEVLIRNLPITTKRKILFIAYGDHGSSPPAVVDMICAHLHTPLVARIGVAELIRSNFALAESLDRLVGKDHIMPNMEQLDAAIAAAKDAVDHKAKHYTSISRTINGKDSVGPR